jgi:flagellar protein FlbD
MIHVTRLNHTEVVLNSDLIEQIDTTPDTVISLTTGEKLMVRESSDEIVRRVIGFRRAISSGCYVDAEWRAAQSSGGDPDGGV